MSEKKNILLPTSWGIISIFLQNEIEITKSDRARYEIFKYDGRDNYLSYEYTCEVKTKIYGSTQKFKIQTFHLQWQWLKQLSREGYEHFHITSKDFGEIDLINIRSYWLLMWLHRYGSNALKVYKVICDRY